MKREKLPNGARRVMALVERSRPSATRPRMSSEWEAQLAELDAQSAACYASMEDISDRLDDVVARLEESDEAETDGDGEEAGGELEEAENAEECEDAGAVAEAVEDEISTVFHLEEVSTGLTTGRKALASVAPTPPLGNPAFGNSENK